MKKVSLLLLVSVMLFAFVACAPRLKIQNDGETSAKDDGMTKAIITFDKAEFDILNLGKGETTAAKSVKSGNAHTISYETDFGTFTFTDAAQFPLVGTDMKNGKTYTWKLEAGTITE